MADSTDTPLIFTEAQIPTVLKILAQRHGSYAAMARAYNVDRANLEKAAKGLRRPGPTLLKRMGITKKLSYQFPVVKSDAK